MKPNRSWEARKESLREWAMDHAFILVSLVIYGAAVWGGHRDAAEHELSVRTMQAADARAVLSKCRGLLGHQGPVEPAKYPPTVAALSPIAVTVFDDHVDVRVYHGPFHKAGLVAYREGLAPVVRGGEPEKVVTGLWLYGRHRYMPAELVGQY